MKKKRNRIKREGAKCGGKRTKKKKKKKKKQKKKIWEEKVLPERKERGLGELVLKIGHAGGVGGLKGSFPSHCGINRIHAFFSQSLKEEREAWD